MGKGSGSVNFKNVFNKDVDYVFGTDNKAFSVKGGEKIGAKKGVSIAVSFKEVAGLSRNGKLFVTC